MPTEELMARLNAAGPDVLSANRGLRNIVRSLNNVKAQNAEFAQPKGIIEDPLENRFTYARTVPPDPLDTLNVVYNPAQDAKLRGFIDGVADQVRAIETRQGRIDKAIELIRQANTNGKGLKDQQIADYYHDHPPTPDAGGSLPLGNLIEQGMLRDVDQAVLLKAVSDKFPGDMNLSLVRGDHKISNFADRVTRAWVQEHGSDGLVYDPGVRERGVKPGSVYGDGPIKRPVDIPPITEVEGTWQWPKDTNDANPSSLTKIRITNPESKTTQIYDDVVLARRYPDGTYQIEQLKDGKVKVITGSPDSINQVPVEGGTFYGTSTRTYTSRGQGDQKLHYDKVFEPGYRDNLISVQYDVVKGNHDLPDNVVYTKYPEAVVKGVPINDSNLVIPARITSEITFKSDGHTEYALDTPKGDKPVTLVKQAKPVRDDALDITSDTTIKQADGLTRYYHPGVDHYGQPETVMTDVFNKDHPLTVSFLERGRSGVVEPSRDVLVTRADRHRDFITYDTADGSVRTQVSWKNARSAAGSTLEQAKENFRKTELYRIGPGANDFAQDPFYGVKGTIDAHRGDPALRGKLDGLSTDIAEFDRHRTNIVADLTELRRATPPVLASTIETIEGGLHNGLAGISQLDMAAPEFQGDQFRGLRDHVTAAKADMANIGTHIRNLDNDGLQREIFASIEDPSVRIEGVHETNPQPWRTEQGETHAVSIGPASAIYDVTGGSTEVIRGGTAYRPPDVDEHGAVWRRGNGALDLKPMDYRDTRPDPRYGRIAREFTPDVPGQPQIIEDIYGNQTLRPQTPFHMPIGDEQGWLVAEASQQVGSGTHAWIKYFEAHGTGSDAHANGVMEVYDNARFKVPPRPDTPVFTSTVANGNAVGIDRRLPGTFNQPRPVILDGHAVTLQGDPGALVIYHRSGNGFAKTELRFAHNGEPAMAIESDGHATVIAGYDAQGRPNRLVNNGIPIPIFREDYVEGIATPWGLAGRRETYENGMSQLEIMDPATRKTVRVIQLDVTGNEVQLPPHNPAPPPVTP
jgi:hypothetical protein